MLDWTGNLIIRQDNIMSMASHSLQRPTRYTALAVVAFACGYTINQTAAQDISGYVYDERGPSNGTVKAFLHHSDTTKAMDGIVTNGELAINGLTANKCHRADIQFTSGICCLSELPQPIRSQDEISNNNTKHITHTT